MLPLEVTPQTHTHALARDGLLFKPLRMSCLCYCKQEITEEERDMLNTRDNLKLVQTLQKSQKFAINVQYLENALMHWKTRVGMEKEPPKEDDKPVILRRRREQIKITLNWKLFYARYGHLYCDIITYRNIVICNHGNHCLLFYCNCFPSSCYTHIIYQ